MQIGIFQISDPRIRDTDAIRRLRDTFIPLKRARFLGDCGMFKDNSRTMKYCPFLVLLQSFKSILRARRPVNLGIRALKRDTNAMPTDRVA